MSKETVAAREVPKRTRRVPLKMKSNGINPLSKPCKEKWCRVLCLENNKEYNCCTKDLGTETCDYVTEDDLQPGNKVVWQYRGATYTAKLIDVHDEKPVPGRKTPHVSRKRYLEDSSSSESDSDTEKAFISKGFSLEKPREPEKTANTTNKKKPRNVFHEQVTIDSNTDDEEDGGTLTSAGNTNGFTDADRDLLISLDRKMGQVLGYLKHLCKPKTGVTTLQPTAPPSEFQERKPGLKQEFEEEEDDRFISESGVNLLGIRAQNPEKYALSLMDALFTDEEMGTSCYVQSKRSKKSPLPPCKVKLLEECIDRKFGPKTVQTNDQVIRRKCNQKCIDIANKRLKQAQANSNKENIE